MLNQKKVHQFHVPVMGTGFSIDTPVKVARYGISSVISLVDDQLIEEMRQFHCEENDLEYVEITKYEEDFRAKRITAYLDLVDDLVKKTFKNVQDSTFEIGSEITKYFEMLPDSSPLRKLYDEMKMEKDEDQKAEMQKQLRASMKPGEIQVNIMTKLDRTNFDIKTKEELPMEYSDALAGLRGYANSKLDSGIVFSAGFNRRLYGYVEKFQDFFADASNHIRKRVILKVSDFRSALIQGRFFAKKGIWVSEYRIESGLNCGGHAFASDGFLMGPIMEEFKKRRHELVETLYGIYAGARQSLNLPEQATPPPIEVTAQGGIGTANEQHFLLNHYELDATGWASPFLLVPEVTNVDAPTLDLLVKAKEKDLYLSDSSPLGVPFNNLKGSPSETERERKVEIGKPGSACPKGYLVSNTEFTEKPICSASRQYHVLKIEALEKENLPEDELKAKLNQVYVKACICDQLADGVLMRYNAGNPRKSKFPAICPGPNVANFSKVTTLQEMADHIYGRVNLVTEANRPNMFIKELKMYIDYFVKETQKVLPKPTEKQIKYLDEFLHNMCDGITYYAELFPRMVEETEGFRNQLQDELHSLSVKIEKFVNEHAVVFPEWERAIALELK